ncbi:peptide chain release factor N(5)-glutamine methyltransferase [Brucepastera parasyntrophica]|uniref:peptide chain release factor N(5)-glutamine methyltransferase n=1 Tax=Brucepastera parasyntrophica TaxID=2880008 RepID=UPI00210A3B88|nr:peptide chain release factor N(5)-glutamine methyltransferase [Brucepastera parasyntrophica]ULQ59345.1 peptide chain release factor N(5)-glutamine methyltransferase [Brucepastera parasyntrophica]
MKRDSETTIGGLIKKGSHIIGKTKPETALLDACLLLGTLLSRDKAYLLSHREETVPVDAIELFYSAVRRRQNGEPVAYITGKKDFWRYSFRVTPAVLIPKPDTEILLERALCIINEQKAKIENNNPGFKNGFQVLDVCTGSGCIAVSLKAELPDIRVTATDISGEALLIAAQNAEEILGSGHTVRFIQGDLRPGLPAAEGKSGEKYMLVVSNPPYVPTETAASLLADGRNEPLLALDGGAEGLDLIRPLIDNAISVLEKKGRILVETGEYNADAAADYLQAKGFIEIAIHKDLSGQNRVIEGLLL